MMTETHHVRIYICQACEDTVCECTTEGDIPPTRCTMQAIPRWERMHHRSGEASR